MRRTLLVALLMTAPAGQLSSFEAGGTNLVDLVELEG